MENNFNNRDFEQFVKQNADQYRMFPSEKVWKNIHYSLHTRRRWYGLGLIGLFLIAGVVTWVMLNNSNSARNSSNETLSFKPAIISPVSENGQKDSKPTILLAAPKPADNKPQFVTNSDNLQKNVFVTAEATPVLNTPINDEPGKNNFATVSSPNLSKQVVIAERHALLLNELPNRPVAVYSKQKLAVKQESNSIISQTTINDPLFTNSQTEPSNNPEIAPATPGEEVYPMSIESVVNLYKHQRKGKKLSWELYVTPTISYRKLTENKAFINAAQANNNLYSYTSVADINSIVTHKPDMGIQVGLKAGYPISKNLKIFAGLQFNVSKYDIKASFSTGEIATIALNTGGGTNSVSTISNYRNSNGSKADWLGNLYFSASVPLGAELMLSTNKKTSWGISGSIQPTYILSDRAYLLSTDYKNYAEVPSLTRKWNMNTGFEIFAAGSTGKLNWRIGPQVRYQLRSSFHKKYPVEEHLFDYGLKLGVMLKK